MDYYFSKLLDINFNDAIKRTTDALKLEGFGIITEIDLQEKFKEKLGVTYKKYRILGACNPGYAYKAVLLEERIGTMLPCNVLVIEQGENKTEVSAVNPIASMMAIENKDLESIAMEITEKLKRVIANL
jgi:uncharacterized protein (DUF302 family)